MFKFLHAADIHLDSPLRGLEAYDGAPVEEIRQATRRALENLVNLAIDEEVQGVLIAGDLYDGDWRNYNTGLFFIRQMAALRDANIRVFIIGGNHDAANKMTRKLRLPENVHFFSSARPETIRLDDFEVALHGQSFARAAVTEDLSAGYPAAVPGWTNIGLIHTCAGCEGHENYAPCTIEGLRRHGYDYWALGHVHRRIVLNENPTIVFPGNIQGRHIRETGAKGCLLVSVDHGQTIHHQFRPLDVFRWEACRIDTGESGCLDDVLDCLGSHIDALRRQHEGMPIGMRVTFSGNARVQRDYAARPEKWVNEIRAAVIDQSCGNVWVEKVVIDPQKGGEGEVSAISDETISELIAHVDRVTANPKELEELQKELSKLHEKLPSELSDGPEGLNLGSIDAIRELAAEASRLLSGRLLNLGRGE